MVNSIDFEHNEEIMEKMADPLYGFCGAWDKHKKSSIIRLRFPPWLYSLGILIVQSQISPYKQFSGLVRDAVYRRIYEWGNILKENKKTEADGNVIISNLQKKIISEWLSEVEDNEQDFKESIKSFSRLLIESLKEDDREKMDMIINQMVKRVLGINSKQYQKKYFQEMKRLLSNIGLSLSKYLSQTDSLS